MKDCEDYDATIQRYLDKELSGRELEEFRAHLEECEVCRAELAAGEQLSGLLHRSRPLYSAPDALRKQIIQTIEMSSSSAPYAPPGLRKRVLKVLARPLQSARRGARNWPALAAAILLVTAGLLPVPRILRQAHADNGYQAFANVVTADRHFVFLLFQHTRG